MERCFVVCLNKREFQKFVDEERANGSTKRFTYVYDYNQLRGLQNIDVSFAGSFLSRPDIMDIYTLVETSKR